MEREADVRCRHCPRNCIWRRISIGHLFSDWEGGEEEDPRVRIPGHMATTTSTSGGKWGKLAKTEVGLLVFVIPCPLETQKGKQMSRWTTKLAVAGFVLVGWTSMGCVVVVEDTVDDTADTVSLPTPPLKEDTAVEEDSTVDEDSTVEEDTSVEDTSSPEDGMSDDATPEAFELISEWDTNFGGTYVITSEKWDSSTIEAFDSSDNWAVTQYPADDEWSPNAFAKQVWTDFDADGFFYHCTIVYSAETLEEEALNAENTANYDDLEGEGCGGFPGRRSDLRSLRL